MRLEENKRRQSEIQRKVYIQKRHDNNRSARRTKEIQERWEKKKVKKGRILKRKKRFGPEWRYR